MNGLFYLAWHYLLYNRYKTSVLIIAVTLTIYIPLGLNVLVNNSAAQLTQRAENTPLLIGAKGSPLDLVLNTLYFNQTRIPSFLYQEYINLNRQHPVKMIPLHTGFSAGGFPVIGTSLAYFSFRNLHLLQGAMMSFLGECVIGANVASTLDLKVGDSLITSPENVFDLAGIYPLKMKVSGILGRNYTADDNAVFTDIKTVWVIAGLGHGHQDLNRAGAISGVLSKSEQNVIANASVRQFNEITAENIDSFHFHGDSGRLPITAVIAVPDNQKQGALLQGQFGNSENPLQIVRADKIIDTLMDTIFTVRHYILIGALILGLSTLAMIVLIFMLSQQLRKSEIETAKKIGASRYFVWSLVSIEIIVVLVISLALALILMWLTQHYGTLFMQQLILK